VTHLLLESGSPGLADPAERLARQRHDRRLALRLLREPLVDFVDYWQELPLFASQKELPLAQQAAVRQGRLQQNKFGLAVSLVYGGTGKQPSCWSALPQLACEILYLAGEKDVKFRKIAHQMKQLQPEMTIKVVANAGHCIHLEQPTQVRHEIDQWFVKGSGPQSAD